MTRPLALLAVVLAGCSSGSAGPAGPAPLPPRRAAAASTAWWNGAVVYEVYVRSFRDSDGDGHGDLAGLIEKLDALNDGDPATGDDLGVDALWLMPINPSPSRHGYDVTDYDGVNPDYGTSADFDRLVTEAHRRGVKIVLDLVVNHTSDQHPWFLESRSDLTAPRRPWYVWSATDPGWKQPWNAAQTTWYPNPDVQVGGWYYALFWSGMPDLDWREPAVRAELLAVASRWMARGVDGFRLDAVRYLVEGGNRQQADQPATHAALKELAAGLRAIDPEVLLVGEAWADAATIASYYGSTALVPGGDELPLAFDFPLADALVRGLYQRSARPIAAALDAATRALPAGAADAPFLTNHDQVRVATGLGGDRAALRQAAAILLTLPGTPFIYYGEELGLPQGSGCSGDECQRGPLPWDASTPGAGFTSGTPWLPIAASATVNLAAQRGDPASVLSAYRALLRLRKGSEPLRRGDLQLLQDPATAGSCLAFTRTAGGETVLVVHNLLDGWATCEPLQAAGRVAVPLLQGGGSLLAGPGGWSAGLPPRATGVWRLDP